ncbi:universal stress protein [Campylobacter geochelonis]|uniref:Universal stress protein n=1 Tax=Campylobacter geochelonis TaxID=1780362 RepID=A0A128EB28_9BACT|nr:universal stress protein [Campylobacter geochelonis]QKF70481.1 universal stress protein [Campylobacter geochelonis]CZE46196.1 universal stress protein [Campylobacter geochelonis]CZE46434.1 universal stress protein [Campylobacter geochelonis]CZE50477.1 universal stress protein [Campylobacter geochelonis]
MKKVVVYLSNNSLNNAVCQYGLDIAKNLNSEVVFLYVINIPIIVPNFLGLAAGGLVVGENSDMIYELDEKKATDEELKEGEQVLQAAKKIADEQGVSSTTDLQKGDFIDILLNYKDVDTFVMAICEESKEVEENITTLTRELEHPILFVNKEFSKVGSVLLAFDGKEDSIKALEFIKDSGIFGLDLKYHIATVNDNEEKASQILQTAREILDGKSAEFITLSGDVTESIIKYRRANNIDSLATGAFSKGMFASFIFGSTSKNIVKNALVPVLVVD